MLDVLMVPADADSQTPIPAPIAVSATTSPFGERLSAVGQLAACVCTKCGFTEFYTKDPSSIPLDDRWVVKRRVGEGSGPFR